MTLYMVMATIVKFLGYIIYMTSIIMDERKVTTIKEQKHQNALKICNFISTSPTFTIDSFEDFPWLQNLHSSLMLDTSISMDIPSSTCIITLETVYSTNSLLWQLDPTRLFIVKRHVSDFTLGDIVPKNDDKSILYTLSSYFWKINTWKLII